MRRVHGNTGKGLMSLLIKSTKFVYTAYKSDLKYLS